MGKRDGKRESDNERESVRKDSNLQPSFRESQRTPFHKNRLSCVTVSAIHIFSLKRRKQF